MALRPWVSFLFLFLWKTQNISSSFLVCLYLFPPIWLVGLLIPGPKWLRACRGWGDAWVAWSRVGLNFYPSLLNFSAASTSHFHFSTHHLAASSSLLPDHGMPAWDLLPPAAALLGEATWYWVSFSSHLPPQFALSLEQIDVHPIGWQANPDQPLFSDFKPSFCHNLQYISPFATKSIDCPLHPLQYSYFPPLPFTYSSSTTKTPDHPFTAILALISPKKLTLEFIFNSSFWEGLFSIALSLNSALIVSNQTKI